MKSTDNNSSTWRYLIARLKPATRPMFWVPFIIFSVGGISAWQYWQHPEWLNSSVDDSGLQTLSDVEREVSNVNPDDTLLGEDVDPNLIATPSFSNRQRRRQTTEPGLLEQVMVQNQQAEAENQTFNLFRPLIPNQKSSQKNPFLISTEDLLNQAALPNYSSLSNPKPQKSQSTPTNSNNTASTQLPNIQSPPIGNRGGSSPLTSAVSQVFGQQTVAQEGQQQGQQQQFANPSPYGLGTNTYTGYGYSPYSYPSQQQPVNGTTPRIGVNSFGQTAPRGYNNPYSSYGQPTQPTQPGYNSYNTYGQPTQPTQPGYNPYNTYGQPTQPTQPGYNNPYNTYGRATQPVQPGYDNPYNTYGQRNQPTQPGYNNPYNQRTQTAQPSPSSFSQQNEYYQRTFNTFDHSYDRY